jgi:hypothetical protein
MFSSDNNPHIKIIHLDQQLQLLKTHATVSQEYHLLECLLLNKILEKLAHLKLPHIINMTKIKIKLLLKTTRNTIDFTSINKFIKNFIKYNNNS